MKLFGVGWIKILWKILLDYSKESSIHGLRYICEGRCFIGIFWIIALSLSISGCSFLISKTYSKWQNSPVIVSLDDKPTPIHMIPFPAVTICPEIKFKRSSMNDQGFLQNITKRKQIYRIKDVLYECIWRNIKRDCSLLFHEIQTDDGLCYTFNMLDQKDLFSNNVDVSMRHPNHHHRSPNWTLQNGYNSSIFLEYPHRALDSGFDAGLQLTLIAKKSDITNKNPVQGFKLALHTPIDIPRFRKRFYRIPLKKEVLLAIEPKVMTTSDDVRDYNLKVRECYFDGEQKLIFFRIYTQTNCELECYVRFLVRNCNCLRAGLHYTRKIGVCDKSMEECLQKTEILWNKNMMGRMQQKMVSHKALPCNCLHSCNFVQYKADISYGDLFYNEFLHATGVKYADDFYASSVKIYFQDNYFIAMKRSELIGITEFLSNCGGLLGLFMGFSLLSIVEFLYYFSLRWACVKGQIEAAENELENDEIKEVTSDDLEVEEFSISEQFNELSIVKVRSINNSGLFYGQHI